ncbi:DUF485 domain-containing protein [Streptomyces bicolor]|uniref:DUF485 domain-containing protein n=1 Tax=Streptomyces bicolor TaxID=66874 RepID=UPI0006908DB3|nr:DUF485 domain-containing protein [Streptomyces bicolor]
MTPRATPHPDHRDPWHELGGEPWNRRDERVDDPVADLLALRGARLRPVRSVTGAVLGLFLLNVVLAALAPEFMGLVLIGRLSVGLAGGLALCAATAVAVHWYIRYCASHVDPVTEELKSHAGGAR